METLLSHELDGFRVHVKAFAPRYRCRWPQRVPGRLCVFLDGTMLERDERYTASDVVYKPPEDRPALSFGESGARTLTIELRDAGIDLLRAGGFAVEEPFRVRSASCQSVAERARAELAGGDEMTPLVIEALVLDLFSRSHRLKRRGAPPAWLERVRAGIDEDFATPRTLGDYAREVGVHPVHLAARFRAHYRASVGEHIRWLRVHHAMRELEGSNKTIGEIALEAGFSDQPHLTRVFRQHVGCTPSQFRKAR